MHRTGSSLSLSLSLCLSLSLLFLFFKDWVLKVTFFELYFLINVFRTITIRVAVSLDFSRKDSIRTLATFMTIRSYEFARREGLEWPASRFIHLSWLTRPISPPLSPPSTYSPLCLIVRYFFYSRKNPDHRPVRSPRILRPHFSSTILESSSLYLDCPIHVRYSCRMVHTKLWLNALVLGGVYVGRRIERLRCLEVADSMMVTFRRERRCFSRPAYLKRDPQTRHIINDSEGNPLGSAYFSSSTVHLFVLPSDFVFVLILRNCTILSSRI